MTPPQDATSVPSTHGLVLCYPGWWGQPLPPTARAYKENPTLRAAISRLHELAGDILGIAIEPVFLGEQPLDSLASSPAGAQCYLLALQISQTMLLREQGAAPAAIMGHAGGTLAALVASGTWGPAQAFQALRARLEALQRAQQSAGWPLAVLGVSCPAFQRDALLALAGRDLTVARTEAPGRFVLAGLAQAVERTMTGARAFQAEARLLPGEGAWNTPWLEPVRQAFEAAISDLPCRPPHTPMLSSHGSEPLGAQALDAKLLADHLARQLVQPLDLPRTAERLHAGGMRHFVIVGPNQGMSSAITSSLGDRPHRVLACQAQGQKWIEGLNRVRAFLEEHGHLHADGPVGLLEPTSRPIPGATLARLLDGPFMAYLEEGEPAVASLLLEAHRRFMAPTSQAPDRGMEGAGLPMPAGDLEDEPDVHLTWEAASPPTESTQVHVAPISPVEAPEPGLSMFDPRPDPSGVEKDQPSAMPEPPSPDDPTLPPHPAAGLLMHQAPPAQAPPARPQKAPVPSNANPAPLAPPPDDPPEPWPAQSQPSGQMPGQERRAPPRPLPVALLTTGSRPLAREDQQRFTCRQALLVTADSSGGAVGNRLRSAGIDVMEFKAHALPGMNHDMLAQALEGCDTLIYLAHEGVQQPVADDALARTLADRIREFYRCFQALAPLLAEHPLRVLVPVSQDGNFGAWPRSPVRPLGAFPAAWVRCLQRELPRCRFQLVDGGDLPWSEAIEQRIDWLTSRLEVGRAPFGMVTPTLVRVGPRGRRDDLLGNDDLLLVIDGDRGPGFEYALALAKRTGARLALTGRTLAPTDRPARLDAAPETLDMVLGQLHHDLVQRQSMGAATAKQVVARARAQWELMRNLDRLRQAGISTRYHCCERVDASVLDRLRGDSTIRGVLIGPPPMPRQLPADPGDFVMLTSLGTLLDLLALLQWDELRMMAACTPLAGWSGQSGQGPLALAGDLLGWLLQALGQRHPQLRALAFAMGGQGDGGKRGREFLEALLGSELPRVAVSDLPSAKATRRPLASFPLAPRPRGRLVTAPEHRQPAILFERARDLWLDQHRTDDEPTLPAAFVAEIFAELASVRGLAVRDLRFRRPVPVRGAALNAEVLDHDGLLLLVPKERSVLAPRLLPRLAFATCRLAPPLTDEPPAMSFLPRELLHLHGTAQEAQLPCYTLLEERFAPTLALGPVFRGIRSTLHTGDRYLGLVSLTDEAMAALALPGTFAFQPVLADLAVQVAMSWALEEHEQLALPTSLAAVHVLGPPREREAVVVCKARDLRSSRIAVDLVVREPDRRPILVLEQLVLTTVAEQDEDLFEETVLDAP